jgi:hypothetical protein
MTTSPVSYQFPSRPGGDGSGKKLAVKIERRLLTLKFYMEMWRIMISEILRIMIPKNVEMIGIAVFLADSGIQA